MEQTILSKYVKAMRKQYNLTQVELSEKSGVGLRLVRELEQGKQTLRLDKVNQILNLFGSEIGVVPMTKPTSDKTVPDEMKEAFKAIIAEKLNLLV